MDTSIQLQENTVRYKSYCSLLITGLFYNMGSFYFGYTMVYFNSIQFPILKSIFNINFRQDLNQGIFSGAIAFGAIFGSILSYPIISCVSRKQSFYITNGLAIIANILILQKIAVLLLIGRIMQGICTGLYSSIVPLMMKQYFPIALSGPFGAFQNIFICVGFLFGFLIPFLFSLALQPEIYWFYVFFFPLITVVFQQALFMTIFKSQTPKYLLIKGRNQQAIALIHEIYKQQYQQIVYQQKLKDLEFDDQILVQNTSKQYPKDNPKAIFLAFSCQMFQQLSGINVIVLYGSELAEGFLPSLKVYLPLIINLEKLIFSIVGSILLNKFGRRVMFLIGLFFVILGQIGYYIGFTFHQTSWSDYLLITSFVVYIFSFVMTLGPIVWIYISETVQPPLVPFTTMTNWIFAFLVITSFPIIRNHSQNKDTPELFLVFLICTSIFFFICMKLMVETKGKTQIEIRQQYNMM